jgi:hypothetical protein
MAHIQHSFKAYKVPNGGVVLHDTTVGQAYLFADAAPAPVHSLTVFSGSILTNEVVGSYEEVSPSDAVSAILPNIINLGSPQESALAKYLQEQTWDQTDIA